MNTFVISVNGDLQIVALMNMSADTDFANIVGEIIDGDDTDDPLVALKNPFPCVSCRDFIWSEMFGGGQIRLSKLREVAQWQLT